MSFTLMGQNRNEKSSGGHKTCGSFLSRHRPDAQVALQQSPILQSDMDRITEAGYNGKREVKSLRPFTQFHEQTRSFPPVQIVRSPDELFFRISFSMRKTRKIGRLRMEPALLPIPKFYEAISWSPFTSVFLLLLLLRSLCFRIFSRFFASGLSTPSCFSSSISHRRFRA